MAKPDNYAIQAQDAKNRFLTYDQEKIIEKFQLQADADYLYPVMLGSTYRLSRKTGDLRCREGEAWVDANTFGGDYRSIDDAAASIPVGSEGLVFHPYLNGELTPYADPKLCASFIGVRASHTKAHFDRAVLEGVAMSMLDCKKALESIGIEHASEATIIGGGASSPLWRQIIADALGFRLVQNEHSDSSFGTAMLAGVCAGIFTDFKSALKICNKPKSVTEPNPENLEKYAKLHARYKAVHDALAPIYDA